MGARAILVIAWAASVALPASAGATPVGLAPVFHKAGVALDCSNPSSPGPRCFDLVFDRGADPNGIPLNPRWGYQVPGAPVSNVSDLCNPIFVSVFSTTVSPSCTSQSPSWDGPGSLTVASVACGFGGGPGHGHSNWAAATYTGGPIYFEDHASSLDGDDDYTMDLHTPSGRGTLKGNRQGGFIHLEFDSDETIDRFGTAWWTQLRHNVDTLGDKFHGRLLGSHAIVTGLMGIDWVHTPGMESHPVYALAIQSSPAGDWGFFVRNNGNEGLCSSNDHPVFFAGDTYTFKFPWAPGATAVSWSLQVHDGLARSLLPLPIPGAWVHVNPVPGDGVYLTFYMPSSLADAKPFYDGEIRFHWVAGKPSQNPQGPCITNPKLCQSNEDDPESMLGALLGRLLNPTQKAALQKALIPPATSDVNLPETRVTVKQLQQFPQPPLYEPPFRQTPDAAKAEREKLRQRLICQDLKGTTSSLSKACGP